MSWWHVGRPGEAVRLLFQSNGVITDDAVVPADVEAQLEPGEVAVAREQFVVNAIVSADGTDVAPRPKTLAELRAERWVEARTYRDAQQLGGCDVPRLGRFDTDADSQRKVGGAATAAMVAKAAGAPFAVNWTLAENTVVALDADAMIGAGMAIVAHLAACQDAGTAIRAQIDAALDAAAIAAVDITAGYPA